MKQATADRARSAPGTATTLPRQAAERLLRDVQADLDDYAVLADLLEQQFAGALQHDGTALQALAERIVAVVERLDGRRQLRSELLARLAGSGGTADVAMLLALWPSSGRAAVQALWERLEDAVRDCKERNLRNARLLTEQQALFARVLHGPQDSLYANA